MNVIGFDDGPFAHSHRGEVLLIGAVCSDTRLDGVVSGRVERDGSDSTERMIELIRSGPFADSVRAVMLQGIAVGGFNVVDVHGLSDALQIPVLVVVRRPPDLDAVRRALFSDNPRLRPPVTDAESKWRLLERAGALEPLGFARRARGRPLPSGRTSADPGLWVQRVGLSIGEARRLVAATTLHGNLPEPLRLAHLIAGGVVAGKSRGRP